MGKRRRGRSKRRSKELERVGGKSRGGWRGGELKKNERESGDGSGGGGQVERAIAGFLHE